MDFTDYKIVVPSYKRVSTFEEKTLKYLIDCNIPMNKIWLFVANEEEKIKYNKFSDLGINIVVGVYKLMNQRNFISDYFKEGEYLIQIDDDIDYLCKKIDDKKYEPFYDLESLIKEAYLAMKESGSRLWGISAVLNAFFMKEGYSTNLKFCVGCFWGCLNDKELKLTLSENAKEDYERNLLYYEKYKSIVRFNGFAPKTSFYKGSGGMNEYRKEIHSKESVERLMKKYPNYVSINNNRKGDTVQIRLKHNKTNDNIENQTSLF